MSTDKRLAIKPALNQFNGGEVSPYLEGRYDWDKYNYSSKLCKNFIPTVEGYLRRRGGSHFVSNSVEALDCDIMFSIRFSNEEDFEHITDVPYVKVFINDEEIKVGHYFPPITFTKTYPEGTILNYTIQADGYIPIAGTTIVEPSTGLFPKTILCTLVSLTDAVTINITPHPITSEVRINGIKTKSLTVQKGTTIDYTVSYGGKVVSDSFIITENKDLDVKVNYVVFKSSSSQIVNITFQDAYYTVKVVGSGGGAGGGSYGKGHKHPGQGGGGGACFVGVVRLSGSKRVKVGLAGMGGTTGRKGGNAGRNGESSYIGSEIIAGGGNAGSGARNGSAGIGGILNLNADIQTTSISSNGLSGSNDRGGSPLLENYGRGGNGVNQSVGQAGTNGYVEIEYYGEV